MSTRFTLRDQLGFRAFMIYLMLSMIFFARGLGSPASAYIGKRADPGTFIWFLQWMAHALNSGINPVLCKAIWAPIGINLSWTTWIPLESFLAMPLTVTAGPVVAYNVVCLLALPVAAWSTFLLCRYLSGSWRASLVGGYLFGFSGYMIEWLHLGDIPLIWVFPIPLAVLLVVRAWNGEVQPLRLTGALIVLLVVQFLISMEVAAVATMFGAIAFALAVNLCGPEARSEPVQLLRAIAFSYVIAFVVLIPYAWWLMVGRHPHGPIWPSGLFVADPIFFLLPSPSSELGQLRLFRAIVGWALADKPSAQSCYLGPVLIPIIASFVWRRRNEPYTRLLVYSMMIVTVLSFGPELTVGPHRLGPMPWALFVKLPLISGAMPDRMVLYLALIGAVITTLWLSSDQSSVYLRIGVAVLAFLFMLPNLSTRWWNTSLDTPTFFSSGLYRKYLARGENALVVPFGWSGNSMLWQAQTDMYFRMAGGWSGPPPYESERWPVVVALSNGTYLPEPGLQLKAFLAAHQVNVVLIDLNAKNSLRAEQRQEYLTVLAALGPPPTVVGGVAIYRLTLAELAAWRGFDPLNLERRVDEVRFASLLDALDQYFRRGGNPVALSAERLEELGLLRANWIGGPNVRISGAFWTGRWPDGTIGAGTFGSRAVLDKLVDEYRDLAANVYRKSEEASENPGGGATVEFILMTFDRQALPRAAALALGYAHRGPPGLSFERRTELGVDNSDPAPNR